MRAARSAVAGYARQLNDTGWVTVLGYAWALFIGLAVLLTVTPEARRAPLKALVELPLDAALVPLCVKDPATVRNIHLMVALGSIYTLVWLLGDRWRVRDGYHVLTATHLDLQVGARASACIPLGAIEAARPLRQPVLEWRRAHPYRDRELLRALEA